MASKPKTSETEKQEPAPVAETSAPVPATISERALAVAGSMTLPDGRVVKVKRNVTLPLLKQREGVPVYVKIEKPYWLAKALPGTDGKKAEEPPFITEVIDISTGILSHFILYSVMKRAFDEDYPNNSYVGKSFAVLQGKKQEGKRHRDVQIIEIADPSDNE